MSQFYRYSYEFHKGKTGWTWVISRFGEDQQPAPWKQGAEYASEDDAYSALEKELKALGFDLRKIVESIKAKYQGGPEDSACN